MIYFLTKKTKIIIVIFLFLLIFTIFNNPIKNTWFSITEPVYNNLSKQGGFLHYFKSMDDLENRNKELEKRFLELESETSECKLIKKELEDLKSAMNLSIHERFKLISTNIIKKESDREYILLNKGENNGVLLDMTVITPENVLVGKVTKVYKNHCEVKLLTAKDFSFNVRIKDKEIETIAKGMASPDILLDLVTKETNITIEDIILSSHTGGIFPEGLLIGKIQNIKREDINPFQEITVTPYYKHRENYNLFLITND